MKIIHLVGMPRSGTTFLQKILSSAKGVETVPEPWLGLRLYGALDPRELSIYNSRLMKSALSELEKGCRVELIDRLLVLESEIYSDLSNNSKIFVEKTPRSLYIMEYLMNNDKFLQERRVLILHRHPAAIFLSVLSTWTNNSLKKFYLHWNDHTYGYEKLQRLTNHPSALNIRYEDLIIDIPSVTSTISEFIDYDVNKNWFDRIYPVDGLFGDPKFAKKEMLLEKKIPPETFYFPTHVSLLFFKRLYPKRRYQRIYPENVNLRVKKINLFRELRELFWLSAQYMIIGMKLNLFFGKSVSKGDRIYHA